MFSGSSGAGSKICFPDAENSRWLAARLLDNDESLLTSIKEALGKNPMTCRCVVNALFDVRLAMEKKEILQEELRDRMAASFVLRAEMIAREVVHFSCRTTAKTIRDRSCDHRAHYGLSGHVSFSSRNFLADDCRCKYSVKSFE